MKNTKQGFMNDLKHFKYLIIKWLIKILLGNKSWKSPIDVLWNMIDEENRKVEIGTDDFAPNCIKIEAWEEAIDRISKECLV